MHPNERYELESEAPAVPDLRAQPFSDEDPEYQDRYPTDDRPATEAFE